jgi:hypothetical protein
LINEPWNQFLGKALRLINDKAGAQEFMDAIEGCEVPVHASTADHWSEMPQIALALHDTLRADHTDTITRSVKYMRRVFGIKADVAGKAAMVEDFQQHGCMDLLFCSFLAETAPDDFEVFTNYEGFLKGYRSLIASVLIEALAKDLATQFPQVSEHLQLKPLGPFTDEQMKPAARAAFAAFAANATKREAQLRIITHLLPLNGGVIHGKPGHDKTRAV